MAAEDASGKLDEEIQQRYLLARKAVLLRLTAQDGEISTLFQEPGSDREIARVVPQAHALIKSVHKAADGENDEAALKVADAFAVMCNFMAFKHRPKNAPAAARLFLPSYYTSGSGKKEPEAPDAAALSGGGEADEKAHQMDLEHRSWIRDNIVLSSQVLSCWEVAKPSSEIDHKIVHFIAFALHVERDSRSNSLKHAAVVVVSSGGQTTDTSVLGFQKPNHKLQGVARNAANEVLGLMNLSLPREDTKQLYRSMLQDGDSLTFVQQLQRLSKLFLMNVCEEYKNHFENVDDATVWHGVVLPLLFLACGSLEAPAGGVTGEPVYTERMSARKIRESGRALIQGGDSSGEDDDFYEDEDDEDGDDGDDYDLDDDGDVPMGSSVPAGGSPAGRSPAFVNADGSSSQNVAAVSSKKFSQDMDMIGNLTKALGSDISKPMNKKEIKRRLKQKVTVGKLFSRVFSSDKNGRMNLDFGALVDHLTFGKNKKLREPEDAARMVDELMTDMTHTFHVLDGENTAQYWQAINALEEERLRLEKHVKKAKKAGQEKLNFLKTQRKIAEQNMKNLSNQLQEALVTVNAAIAERYQQELQEKSIERQENMERIQRQLNNANQRANLLKQGAAAGRIDVREADRIAAGVNIPRYKQAADDYGQALASEVQRTFAYPEQGKSSTATQTQATTQGFLGAVTDGTGKIEVAAPIPGQYHPNAQYPQYYTYLPQEQQQPARKPRVKAPAALKYRAGPGGTMFALDPRQAGMFQVPPVPAHGAVARPLDES